MGQIIKSLSFVCLSVILQLQFLFSFVEILHSCLGPPK